MNATLQREEQTRQRLLSELFGCGGETVWVGGGAIICPGVTIGSKTVIGTGSVVTRDIPDRVFAAGNPSRIIRQINESGHE